MIPEEDGIRMTECDAEQLEFYSLGRRAVVAKFDGGTISSDAGGLLPREVERRTGILRQLAQQFTDADRFVNVQDDFSTGPIGVTQDVSAG